MVVKRLYQFGAVMGVIGAAFPTFHAVLHSPELPARVLEVVLEIQPRALAKQLRKREVSRPRSQLHGLGWEQYAGRLLSSSVNKPV